MGKTYWGVGWGGGNRKRTQGLGENHQALLPGWWHHSLGGEVKL